MFSSSRPFAAVLHEIGWKFQPGIVIHVDKTKPIARLWHFSVTSARTFWQNKSDVRNTEEKEYSAMYSPQKSIITGANFNYISLCFSFLHLSKYCGLHRVENCQKLASLNAHYDWQPNFPTVMCARRTRHTTDENRHTRTRTPPSLIINSTKQYQKKAVKPFWFFFKNVKFKTKLNTLQSTFFKNENTMWKKLWINQQSIKLWFEPIRVRRQKTRNKINQSSERVSAR